MSFPQNRIKRYPYGTEKGKELVLRAEYSERSEAYSLSDLVGPSER